MKIPGLEELEDKIREAGVYASRLRKDNEKLRGVRNKLEKELQELKRKADDSTSPGPEVLKEVKARLNRLLAKVERIKQ